MSERWQVQEAKARFSEFLAAAERDGPQIVTRRGVETAVLVPIAQWRSMETRTKRNIKELLLAPEARTENLTPTRSEIAFREPPDLIDWTETNLQQCKGESLFASHCWLPVRAVTPNRALSIGQGIRELRRAQH